MFYLLFILTTLGSASQDFSQICSDTAQINAYAPAVVSSSPWYVRKQSGLYLNYEGDLAPPNEPLRLDKVFGALTDYKNIYIQYVGGIDHWTLANAPNINARATLYYLSTRGENTLSLNEKDLDAVRATYQKNLIIIRNSTPQTFNISVTHDSVKILSPHHFGRLSVGAGFGECLRSFRSVSCGMAVRSILTEFRTIAYDQGFTLLGFDQFQETLTTTGLPQALARVQLKMDHQISLLEKKSATHASFLFDDIKAGLIEYGYESKAADKMTWDLLTFFGTRAHAFRVLNRIYYDHSLMIQLEQLFLAANYLDSLYQNRFGHYYSLPRTIQTSCKQSKTYHFWMAAGLAHHLRTHHSYSRTTSIQAVHTLGYFYDLGSRSRGREDLSRALFHTYDSNEPLIHSIKITQVFRSAGAIYGAEPSERTPIAIDQALSIVFDPKRVDGRKLELCDKFYGDSDDSLDLMRNSEPRTWSDYYSLANDLSTYAYCYDNLMQPHSYLKSLDGR